jgi:MobA/VirD2-like, nuclease domain
MIPFASQRGGGQDLATHLMNAHDNEQVDLFSVRGAVAGDLHGALAEWEAIAGALTRCRQYLCSLSINPDERQGRLTRDQYLDYIARAEGALGLAGQPRAIVFHIKRDEHGRAREHCHVVWSRIDVQNKRAVPLSFFKEKMMTVTRAFARDHGLALPPGYERQEAAQRRNRQLSAYDCVKQKQTGITHEDRMGAVTDAWRHSDTGSAFVGALADLGYILAQGRNGTRVVLVDAYGHTTALTRLIDDTAVRARHVRDFLGPDYAPDKLPTVERAQEIAAQRRTLIEAFETAREEPDDATALIREQAARRLAIEREMTALRQQQHQERAALAAAQQSVRRELKSAYLSEGNRIRLERARRKPKGLAAFLGRVTGVALITRKAQCYRDRKRYGAYLALREALNRRQQHERDALARLHELRAADIQRRMRALEQIERRERQTLETAALRARRQAINARHIHMPSLASALKETDGTGVRRLRTPLAQEFARSAEQPPQDEHIRLTQAFARVSGGGEDESGEAGGSDAPAPAADETIRRRRKRPRRRKALIATFTDAAGAGDDASGEGGGADSPAPAAEEKILRRKPRRRRPDLDREFNAASGAGDARTGGDDSDGRPRRRKPPRRPDPPGSGGPPRRPRKRDSRPRH